MTRNTGPTAAVKAEVAARAGYRCERCRTAYGPFAIHHRRARRMGGSRDPLTNDPSNLALLCDYRDDSCHVWTEREPAEAFAAGWLLHANDDPRLIAAEPLRVAS